MVNKFGYVTNLNGGESPCKLERLLSRFAEFEMDEERRLSPRTAVLVYVVLGLLAWGLVLLVGWGLWAVIG